jgi:hypothetical protein
MNAERPGIRRFHFTRTEDVSGVSGTGIVGEGCELTNGKIIFSWLSNLGSVAVYDNVKTFLTVHGHEGKGKIEWIDPDPSEEPEPEKKTPRKKPAPKK